MIGKLIGQDVVECLLVHCKKFSILSRIKFILSFPIQKQQEKETHPQKISVSKNRAIFLDHLFVPHATIQTPHFLKVSEEEAALGPGESIESRKVGADEPLGYADDRNCDHCYCENSNRFGD